MPAAGLLAVLDDIATVLDDVALLTKVAAKKTAGVLGDDLALNAQQVGGVRASRELPVVWAVAKGSFLNKAMLVPAALALSALAPWSVTPLLMVGGAYLCFEGFEKIAHKLLHRGAEHHASLPRISAPPERSEDMAAIEKEKVKGAVRTDFILSAEIVAITLGTVEDAAFVTRMTVLTGVSILMTVGVYGLVAGIVKLDDLGLYLTEPSRQGPRSSWSHVKRSVGGIILRAAPFLMKALSIAGTAAMFLVGGGILTHGVPMVHDWIHQQAERVAGAPGLARVVPLLVNTVAGVVAGAIVLLAVAIAKLAVKKLSR